MRGAATVLFLALLCSVSIGQEKKILLFVTPSSNVSTAEIGKSLSSRCTEVSVTLDQGKSTYGLEAIYNGAGPARKPYKFSLFDQRGDYVFSTQTARLSNAVKDICSFVRKDKH